MRLFVRISGLFVAGMLLSGCVKANLNLTVLPDDQVSGDFIVGVAKDIPGLDDTKDIQKTLAEVGSAVTDAFKTETQKYDDGRFAGERFVLPPISLKAFAKRTAELGPPLVTREGDYFVVNGQISPAGAEGLMLDGVAAGAVAAAASTMDLRITIYLPGEITDTNGIVDGNTISWQLSPTEPTTLSARSLAPQGEVWVDRGSTAAGFSTPSGFSKLSKLSRYPTFAAFAGEAAKTVGVTTVLAVLIALPTNLLTTVLLQHKDDIAKRFRRRRQNANASEDGSTPHTGRWVQRLRNTGILLAASALAVSADPRFGFNALTARMIGTAFGAFVITNILGTWISYLWARRLDTADRPHFVVRPSFLLIVAGAAGFARLTSIEPALVFGAVVAIELATAFTGRRRAAVTIAGALVSLLVGMGAWFVYSLMYQSSGVVVTELASLVCIEALTALPIALLPLVDFDGLGIWQWSKVAWVVMYGMGLAAFSLVLLPLPASWDSVSESLATWVTIYAIYCAVAVTAWIIGRRLAARPAAASS